MVQTKEITEECNRRTTLLLYITWIKKILLYITKKKKKKLTELLMVCKNSSIKNYLIVKMQCKTQWTDKVSTEYVMLE